MSSSLSESEARLLLKLARKSIQAMLEHKPLELDFAIYPDAFQALRAPFVTLYHHGKLRGCIGALEAEDSLLREVVRLAPSAARDPRFDPVSLEELPDLTISLSILTEPQAVDYTDDVDLAARLRPGIDGLILEEGRKRGTLLPVVWENLPDPMAFIQATKQKAGLAPDYASPGLRASVYQAEEWSE